jgi:hypothetical protein
MPAGRVCGPCLAAIRKAAIWLAAARRAGSSSTGGSKRPMMLASPLSISPDKRGKWRKARYEIRATICALHQFCCSAVDLSRASGEPPIAMYRSRRAAITNRGCMPNQRRVSTCLDRQRLVVMQPLDRKFSATEATGSRCPTLRRDPSPTRTKLPAQRRNLEKR